MKISEFAHETDTTQRSTEDHELHPLQDLFSGVGRISHAGNRLGEHARVAGMSSDSEEKVKLER